MYALRQQVFRDFLVRSNGSAPAVSRYRCLSQILDTLESIIFLAAFRVSSREAASRRRRSTKGSASTWRFYT